MAKRRHRSPSYPSLRLEDAIDRARTFFSHEGKHQSTIGTAAVHWGFSPTSSTPLTTIAALKAYGLMDDSGEGKERKVQLTPLGIAIVQDERAISPERDEAIRQAVLKPKAMADLWQKYGVELPSDDTLAHYLKVEREFNPNSVSDVIRIYKANLAFAELDNVDTEGEEGDFEQPEDTEAPAVTSEQPPIQAGKVVAAQVAGDEEIANIRVSRDCTIRLLATGPYSRKSIEALVAQLKLGLELGTYDDLEEE